VSYVPQQYGDVDYPTIYTKVSAVRDWIIEVSSALTNPEGCVCVCNGQIIPNGITKANAMP